MKTKHLFRFALLMIAAMTISFTGCKKDTTTSKDKANTESMQQLSNDENTVENASDQAMNDANQVLSGGKLKSTESGPCNTTVTIGPIVDDTITVDIFYHGKDCAEKHIRSGHIYIKKKYSEEWSTPGATVLVIFDNFTIVKISNGKSVRFNGTKHYQNVSGHYIWQLGLDSTVTSIVDKLWGTITATFDSDNTSKVWNIARQRTLTGSLIALVVTTDGFGTADGYTQLATWGTNRNGEQFYSRITQSVVHRMLCNWDPCSGIIIHEIPSASKSATITFGYDSNNNLITNGDCPSRYRIDWVVGNLSGTFFLPL